jgi:hypothetical protein
MHLIGRCTTEEQTTIRATIGVESFVIIIEKTNKLVMS